MVILLKFCLLGISHDLNVVLKLREFDNFIRVFFLVPESASVTPSVSTTSWATFYWSAARKTSPSESTTALLQHEDNFHSGPTALPLLELEVQSRECSHHLTWPLPRATVTPMLATACLLRCTLVTDTQRQAMEWCQPTHRWGDISTREFLCFNC